jgi:hypothetical protein
MYVNPIEILGLSNATDITSIDNEIVKKAKRKLFADIDLSDNGVFEYYGLQLTKGNCEKAIDELTNNEFKEFYLYLANNKPLNEFLANGKEVIFKNFKQDSIFKLPEFVKFISPYFAPKFDKALLTAFENDNADLTKAILNTSSLIAQTSLFDRDALWFLPVCKVRRTNWLCNFGLSGKPTGQTNRNDNLRWTCIAISTVF